jgi:hypothetical protein
VVNTGCCHPAMHSPPGSRLPRAGGRRVAGCAGRRAGTWRGQHPCAEKPARP